MLNDNITDDGLLFTKKMIEKWPFEAATNVESISRRFVNRFKVELCLYSNIKILLNNNNRIT